MEPDPQEIKHLEEKIAAFDEAYVGLVQAVMRIKNIYKIDTLKVEKAKTVPKAMPHPTESTGNFCPRCHSMRVIIKGAGCVVCLDCQFDMGCGG